MKMNKSNIKGDVSFLTITILISIISFGVILNYLTSVNSNISDTQEDILCNNFVKLKGERVYNYLDFFYQLNVKCSVDKYIIKDDLSTNEIYKTLADSSSKCYFRYGEGKYDFLEKYQANGNWCFLCGKVEFENKDMGRIGSYLDFIDWTKKNKMENLDQTYYNYTNYLYINETNKQELISLQTEIEELVQEISTGDTAELTEVSLLTLNKYQSLVDFSIKEIDSTQNYYVTYRFDRLDKSYEDKMEELMLDAEYSIYGGIIASIGTEIALNAVGGATFGLLCGPAAPGCALVTGTIGGIVGAIKGVVKSFYTGGKAIVKVNKMLKKMKALVSSSKKVSLNTEDLVSITTRNGEIIKLSQKINVLKATPDDLITFSTNLKKEGYAQEVVNVFENLGKTMKNQNVKNLDDLKSQELLSIGEDLVQLDIKKLENTLSSKDVLTLNKLKENAIDNINDIKSNKKLNSIELRYYITFIIGAYIGYNFEPEENPSNQYIDIMTKEEFYRNCGFPPGETSTN